MFEAIRRLTANYTEEEYHRWLWCDGLSTWVDMDANLDKWYYAKNLNYTSVHEIADDLMEVSEDTGYDYNFLIEMYTDSIRDGQSCESAMEYVAGISYEKDW